MILEITQHAVTSWQRIVIVPVNEDLQQKSLSAFVTFSVCHKLPTFPGSVLKRGSFICCKIRATSGMSPSMYFAASGLFILTSYFPKWAPIQSKLDSMVMKFDNLTTPSIMHLNTAHSSVTAPNMRRSYISPSRWLIYLANLNVTDALHLQNPLDFVMPITETAPFFFKNPA